MKQTKSYFTRNYIRLCLDWIDFRAFYEGYQICLRNISHFAVIVEITIFISFLIERSRFHLYHNAKKVNFDREISLLNIFTTL